jgi:hypothetical protein
VVGESKGTIAGMRSLLTRLRRRQLTCTTGRPRTTLHPALPSLLSNSPPLIIYDMSGRFSHPQCHLCCHVSCGFRVTWLLDRSVGILRRTLPAAATRPDVQVCGDLGAAEEHCCKVVRADGRCPQVTAGYSCGSRYSEYSPGVLRVLTWSTPSTHAGYSEYSRGILRVPALPAGNR